ncbi:MAG: RNA 2',3'-cyclic phosphodiesterase [Chloroflexota bacterium]
MPKPIRTFIAIELSQEIKTYLAAMQARLDDSVSITKPVVRWTNAKNVHLTLRFLGDTTSSQVTQLKPQLRSLAENHQPFSVAMPSHQSADDDRAKPIGVFPNWQRPSIVWAGITGELDVLFALQVGTESVAQTLGFAAETRKFSPHVTIGRIKAGRRMSGEEKSALRMLGTQLRDYTARYTRQELWQIEPPPMKVSEFTLIQSQLRPSGPAYTPLERFKL